MSNSIDKEVRHAYIERYSQERVTWACRKSSAHKSRSSRFGCTEHFTAWQWLDLCGANDFHCTYCGEVKPLEPHHNVPLSDGGTNKIDNIVVLCRRYHHHWEDYPHDVSGLWMADQQKLLSSFSVGDRVKRNYSCRLPIDVVGKRQEGTIVQLYPAQWGSPPLRGRIRVSRFKDGDRLSYYAPTSPTAAYSVNRETGERVLLYEEDYAKEWRDAYSKALVHWFQTVKGVEVITNEIVVNLKEIKKVEITGKS